MFSSGLSTISSLSGIMNALEMAIGSGGENKLELGIKQRAEATMLEESELDGR